VGGWFVAKGEGCCLRGPSPITMAAPPIPHPNVPVHPSPVTHSNPPVKPIYSSPAPDPITETSPLLEGRRLD
jgi:hypothetical protein